MSKEFWDNNVVGSSLEPKTQDEVKIMQMNKLGQKTDQLVGPVLSKAQKTAKDMLKKQLDKNKKKVVKCETDINAYDPMMDNGSWSIYNNIETNKEMTGLNLGPLDSFCNSYQHSGADNLNIQCNNLTEHNCKRVGCCVYTSDNKCLAGYSSGPINSINIDYYYYKNKKYSGGGVEILK